MRKIANECASDSITLGLGYALAILTAGTDLIFLMLALLAVIPIPMKGRERAIIVGIFVLATM